MKDYLNFQPEDFAQDDLFIHWVKSTDISAETFWQNWLETYPFKRNDVEAARQLVLLTQNLPEPKISDSEIKLLKESVFSKIESIENKRTKVRALRYWWASAAVIAGMLFFAGWYLKSRPALVDYSQLVEQAAEKYDLVQVENRSKTTRLVNLPDGSSVVLKKGSKLSFPNHFGNDKREIYLTGEAFFEIARDVEKPFYVYANEIVTKVLGTSFNVRAYEKDKEISVTVKTGRVAVYKAGGREAKSQSEHNRLDGMVLAPNQKAVFMRENISIVKKRIEPEVAVVTPEIDQMAFEYQEKPVGEIFAQLEKAYDIRVIYDKAVFGKCPVTASLTGEPLYEKLKLVCKAVRAQYQIVNGEIVITGSGCF